MKLKEIKTKNIGYIKLSQLNTEERKLYDYLLKEYSISKVASTEKHSLHLNSNEKVHLFSIKHKNSSPYDSWEYALYVGELFVNTTWISYAWGYTEIMTIDGYIEKYPDLTCHKINY